MSDLHLKQFLVFLNDLIIFPDTLKEHESRLLRVPWQLEEFGFKLSLEKCEFFHVHYLGHIASEQVVAIDPEKISPPKSWPYCDLQDITTGLSTAMLRSPSP